MTTLNDASGMVRDLLNRERFRSALLVERDYDQLERLLDEELVYTHSTGLVQDKAAYLDYVRGSLAYVSVEHTQARARLLGEAALLTCNLKSVMRVEGQAASVTIHTHVMQVWLPAPCGWRLAAFQATRMPIVQP